MRQNPFFFGKAESATNVFKAGDVVNTMQMTRKGWEAGPMALLHGRLPPTSLSLADLKGLQATWESEQGRGEGQAEEWS